MSRRCNRNNFRHKLKLILKAGQRCATNKEKEDYIGQELIKLGYIADCSDVWLTLHHKDYNKISGRVLARIGRAALKKNQLALLSIFSWNYSRGENIHQIKFTPEKLCNEIKRVYECPTQTITVAATNKSH